MKLKYMGLLVFVLAMLFAVVTPAFAGSSKKVGFGELYYNGDVVRTVVPPAAAPKMGKDNLYAVPGQRAVAAVAPGDRDYHGGKWAFHSVEWNVDPYLLTSEEAVLAAAEAGDIEVTRVPENDFKCPIQP